MKFTLSWLNEFVETGDLSPEQLGERLTMLGLEVDSIEELYAELGSIVTAGVLKVKPHPNADKLTLCEVDTGSEVIQVVCGAPNVREGMMTALALPGVTLPGGMKIKKSKVRGEQSLGMLCSAKELGIRDDHSGIMELDQAFRAGEKLVDCLGLRDTMVEIDLTPNRPDCASVIGIAREVSGFTRNPVRPPVQDSKGTDSGKADFLVTIEDSRLCPRYAARKMTGVTIEASPWWLQRRLLSIGLRPINNIVDVTNLVMFEYGQPLHAFDYDKLRGGKIIVRCAEQDEKSFSTLDEVERNLNSEMLMICDAEGPVAVAGVMGGLNSEIDQGTTTVLLESACFDPISIRRTARALNLNSEASYRFERGVDPNGVGLALERAVQLISEITGAVADTSGVDEYPGRKDLIVLDLRVERVNQLLGIMLEPLQVADHLRSIGFVVEEESNSVLKVTIPSFRVDIEREIDLVEEIARLVGYNDIPSSMPRVIMDSPQDDKLRSLRNRVTDFLTSIGICEAINYSFSPEKHCDMIGLSQDDLRRRQVKLLNPLSADQSVMRSTLLPGLLENIKHNLNFQQPDIRLFEIGKTFIDLGQDRLPHEDHWLCVVQAGNRYPGSKSFYFSGLQTDFFDIKGVAEQLVDWLRIQGKNGPLAFSSETTGNQIYSEPSTSLSILDGETEIGRLGTVTQQAARRFGIKEKVFFFEINLGIVADLPTHDVRFRSLPRFPAVKRDIALVISEDIAAGELVKAVRGQQVKYVEKVEIFDVYSGKPIEKGLKSVALSITYRSQTATLKDETVDKTHDKIVNTLMSEFGGRYREGQE